MTGGGASAKVWGGTFHAVANRLLRVYGRAIGLANDFTVIDQGDAADLMNLIRNELGLGKGGRRFPRKDTLVKIYSRSVNARDKLADVLQKQFPWCEAEHDALRRVFESYTRRKRARNVMDYDDLLLFWNVLANESRVAGDVADQFLHILVDEYQDTNAVQASILRGMRRNGGGISVVGDDAQSIYSFRAATVRNILDFPEQFPGTRVVTLEQNYRSIQPILDASNAVMDAARQRYTKNLWSERGSERRPALVTCVDESNQCQEVCQRILEHHEEGVALHRQAVLFRAGYHSDMLEVELTRRNIPFHKYGGLKFIEAAHIKDMLAFLRVLENPYDEISWFRVLQLLAGVGPKLARRVMEDIGIRGNGALAVEQVAPDSAADSAPADDAGIEPTPTEAAPAEDRAMATPLRLLFEHPPAVPAGAREQFLELVVALGECCGWTLDAGGKDRAARASGAAPRSEQAPRLVHSGKAPPLPAQLDRIRGFYEPIFNRIYDNAAMRLRDIEQLAQIASRYRSRGSFITDLTLDPPQSTSDLAGSPHLDEDYLVLSTIHSAKGCEWDVVYIIHAADGMMPSDMATTDEDGVEEERRLFYVAMTRAKDHLYIHFPLRYYHRMQGLGDRHSYAQLTRFIPPGIRHLFAAAGGASGGQVGPDYVDEADASQVDPAAESVDAFLNDLWEE